MRKLLILITCISLSSPLFAQFGRNSNSTVTFDELYDAPYDINKLFVQFIPVYSELFVTNINMGYGLDLNYYWADKFDFEASARTPYYRVTDFSRSLAVNQDNTNTYQVVDNEPFTFLYIDGGATYHIIDREVDSESKVALVSKNDDFYKSAARPTSVTTVQNKKREIVGIRMGGMFYNSSSRLNPILNRQGVALEDTARGFVLPDSIFAVGNLSATGFYLGTSWTRIKNFAAKPTRTYNDIIDDLMFTAYFDLIFMPWMNLEDIRYTPGQNEAPYLIPTDNVGLNPFGFRFGFEGKFNRKFGWGWTAETGLRPGLRRGGFYAMVKFAFPVYSTDLNYEVESFGK